MVITKRFDVDLVGRKIPLCLDCMQGDADSRAIAYSLFEDGSTYAIPSNATLRIAYQKADKTGGVYSQMPDGTAAYEITGNTVTVRLVADVLAEAGMAVVQPILYDSTGTILGVWSTDIVVWRTVSKEQTSTGVNYSSYENDIGVLQAKVKRLEALVDGGGTTETCTITQNCVNCASSSGISIVNKGGSFTATYTPDSGYISVTLTVKMGDADITSSAATNGRVSISEVAGDVVITAKGVKETYQVVNSLTDCTSSNKSTNVEVNGTYTATITQSGDYKLKTVVIKMAGTDITDDVVTYSTSGSYNIRNYVSAEINIPKVTGKLEITGVGEKWYWMSLTAENCTTKQTTGCVDKQHSNYAWDGDTFKQVYAPATGYTGVSITVKKGSASGTDVTSSVVDKTAIGDVLYDSITINDVHDKYYITVTGTK